MVHDTQENSSDNNPASYTSDIHHCPDVVYWTEELSYQSNAYCI